MCCFTPGINSSSLAPAPVMVLLVLCWFCAVACVSSKVVHQANGIVSIITEIEPDRTPVAYLQAVDTPGRAPSLRPPEKPVRVSTNIHQGNNRPPETRNRGVPFVVQTENIPLEEGQFRVKSAEIRLVNPDTRLVQHAPAPVEEKKEEQVASEQEDERKNDPKAESASDNKVVYPLKNSEDDQANRESRYRGDFTPNRDLDRPKKQGRYGYQTPRGGDVRNDPNTRIRDDDRPTKIYKQATDRPLRRGDEFVTSKRKTGKAGYYVTNPPLSRPSYRRPSDNDRNKDSGSRDFRRDDLRDNNNNGRIKTEKDYSSKTVVKYPNGQAHEKERRVESSSKFKIGSSENKKYPNPTDYRKNDRFSERSPFNRDETESDELHGSSSFLESSIENDDGSFEHSYSGKDFYGRNRFGDYGNTGLVGIGGGYRGGYGNENHFEKAGGNDYVTASEFARGAKGSKGHSDEDSFLNEQSEKHGHGKNKGYTEEKDSDKKSHLDESTRYTSGQQASVGSKGENFHKNKGHRKGHKKSGFHSVVHKDEFNKKEEFYDEEHNSGEDRHHGHKSGQHVDKAGGHDKKEHLDSGHHDSHRGHEGGHDKGQRYQQQQRYHKDRGHSGHYGHEDEHEKRSGHKEGEIHQHSEFGRYR